MLSAVTGIDQQIKAREIGRNKILTKPTTPSKLISAVDEVLSQIKIKSCLPHFMTLDIFKLV